MKRDYKRPCPNCGEALKEVYAEANYGRVLLVDQCPGCGGIWFDRWELYLLKEEEALRLDRVDPEALCARRGGRSGTFKCPVCEVELVRFTDPVLPPDAGIRRCPLCSGLWLNRGELARYAEHRRSTRGPGALGAKGPGLDTLKRLQKELDLSGLNIPAAEDPELTAPGPGELAKDLAPLVLHILLRLLLRF